MTHDGRCCPAVYERLISSEQWEALPAAPPGAAGRGHQGTLPKWSLAGLAVCGQCGGKMYCTSSQRGEQHSLYCSTQRTSGVCTGTYRTRQPVEAAVALWLQGYAHDLEAAAQAALADAPKQPQDPHKAERRRLGKVIESADAKLGRLLDACTDGAPGLDLPEYKRRREGVQQEVEQARARLAQLDEPQTQAPTSAAVKSFADAWPALSVDARHDVTRTLLSAVRINQDKTVELIPRWGEPVTDQLHQTEQHPRAARQVAGPQR